VFLVWTLLSLLLLMVLLLAVPLEWGFYVQLREGHRSAESRIFWLFGLVRFRVSSGTGERSKPKAAAKAQKPKRRRANPMAVVGVEGFIGRVLTLVRRLLGAIHIQHLDMQGRLGLGDPADTGRLWSVVGPLSAILAVPQATRIHLEPDFSDLVLELQSRGRIRLVPLRLVSLALGFLLSATTMRAFKAMRSGA